MQENQDITEKERSRTDNQERETELKNTEPSQDQDQGQALMNLFKIERLFKGTLIASSLLLVLLTIMHFTLQEEL